MSALLFYKLNDADVFTLYDLNKNNKELFKKRFHGYVLGRKIPVLYDITDVDDDGYISKTARALHDINEIYMKYTRTNDKMATVKANEKNKNF